MNTIEVLLVASFISSVPVILASLGVTITKKSGITNLSVNGTMMLIAYVVYFVFTSSGNQTNALAASVLMGVVLSVTFGALVLFIFEGLRFSEGISIVIVFVLGWIPENLAKYLGVDLINKANTIQMWDFLAIATLPLVIATWYFLNRTKYGLMIRACGEAPHVLYNNGHSILKTRLLAILVGSVFIALAAIHIAVFQTKVWSLDVVVNRGWLAIILVFLSRGSLLKLVGYSFFVGILTSSQFFLQAYGFQVPTPLLSALPFVSLLLAYLRFGRKLPNGF